MKIVSWNVNGLRSVITKGFPNILAPINPDIVCLQETKIQNSQLEEIKHLISAYDFPVKEHHSEAVKKGYSGVMTLFDPKLAPATPAKFTAAPAHTEGRYIASNFGGFILYNVYFPSGTSGEERQNYKYEFLHEFYTHITGLPESERKKLVICGDFNICHREIDIHHPEEATRRQLTGFLPEERKWMDRFCDAGFIDSFRFKHPDLAKSYTWWSFRANSRAKNLGWRIDYIFVSKELSDKLTSAEIHSEITGSDHCPISITLEKL